MKPAMRWDPITYLLHRTDRLERANHELRLHIDRTNSTTQTTFGKHARRIELLESWQKSIRQTTRRWPLAIVILGLGIAANVAPKETAEIIGIALRAAL